MRSVNAEDAEPVRHGKWTEKAIQDCGHMDLQEAKCSECGRWLQTPYNYYFIDYEYCPNCGAKMEDEASGNDTNVPTIDAEPAWKPACVNPQESGTYLTVWDLCRNQKPFASYKILNYGDFEDWNDELKSKTGWWEFDSEWGVCDMTESVLYWMPLPEPPKENGWL